MGPGKLKITSKLLGAVEIIHFTYSSVWDRPYINPTTYWYYKNCILLRHYYSSMHLLL